MRARFVTVALAGLIALGSLTAAARATEGDVLNVEILDQNPQCVTLRFCCAPGVNAVSLIMFAPTGGGSFPVGCVSLHGGMNDVTVAAPNVSGEFSADLDAARIRGYDPGDSD